MLLLKIDKMSDKVEFEKIEELDKKIDELWHDNPELWEKIKNKRVSDLPKAELVEMLNHLTSGMFRELVKKVKA